MDEGGEVLLDKVDTGILPVVNWTQITWGQLQPNAERPTQLDREDIVGEYEDEQELNSRNNERIEQGRGWSHFVRKRSPMEMSPWFHKTQ